MSFYDAHCHLQDDRIRSQVGAVSALYEKLDVQGVVVNGTSENDWDRVEELARSLGCLRPAFGLHPWKVSEASLDWKTRLAGFWDRNPDSSVGEIGLDRWIEGFDLPAQEEAFLWQLRQAAERGLAASIHCLKAWGRLREVLESSVRPGRGFLLHSYGGPAEMIEPFVKLGGYFSISGYFALERKAKQREVLRKIPLDRLLIETDAPDMLGPAALQRYSVEGDLRVNHPANIVAVYDFVAELFGVPAAELQGQVEANFEKLFGRV